LLLALREYRRWSKSVGCWYRGIASCTYLYRSIAIYLAGLFAALIITIILMLTSLFIWDRYICKGSIWIYYVLLIPIAIISSVYYGLYLWSMGYCDKLSLLSRRLFKVSGLLNIVFTAVNTLLTIIFSFTENTSMETLNMALLLSLPIIKCIESLSWYTVKVSISLETLLNTISLRDILYVCGIVLMGLGSLGSIAETTMSSHYTGTFFSEGETFTYYGLGGIKGYGYYMKIYSIGDILLNISQTSKYLNNYLPSGYHFIEDHFREKEYIGIGLENYIKYVVICHGESRVYDTYEESSHRLYCAVVEEGYGKYGRYKQYGSTAWSYKNSGRLSIILHISLLSRRGVLRIILLCNKVDYTYVLTSNNYTMKLLKGSLHGPCKLYFVPSKKDNVRVYNVVYVIETYTKRHIDIRTRYHIIIKSIISRSMYRAYNTPYVLLICESIQGDLF